MALAAAAALSACGGGEAPTTDAEASASPSAGPRQGTVEFDGTTVGYVCFGEGSPALMLEAGTGTAGTRSFPAPFIDPIAAVTTVCTYDRLGTSAASSQPPDDVRSLDDLVAVLDGAIGALGLEPPVIVGGQSGGGNIAIAYAEAHPDKVAGLVTIDSYHDDPAKMKAEQDAGGFVWQEDPEHMDWVQASVEQDAYAMPFGEFPVLVISATQADTGGPQNQAFWLAISPDSEQVVVEGPHDLQFANPEGTSAPIVALVSGR
ncbi:hypothetical protein GCM10009819_29540 [Agromyces tropicus]|uniref:AB hydrolase-1 domain-containing protein n=1 Tax=Agromyces tropicus TaxID=555371 RepID=A0ABP5GC34_9MICO